MGLENGYHYAIIKENYPELDREKTLLDSKYLKSKKYALIDKGVHKDGSESIYFIRYSSSLEELQQLAHGYVSWYNYPMQLSKSINGYISEI